ncbi:MAG TPA: tetratricopeptide repeat protein [Polyangiaceae bacterium]|jgi:ferric-dicitrate binding protein FerR (iron transport regulator)|nr:tetratricopeptide repeat protein [Polyangiaceae bacterium]
MNRRDPSDLRALHALAKLVRETVQPPTAAALDRGLNLLMGRATAQRARRPKVVYWSLAAALALVCGVLGVQLTSFLRDRAREQPALAYRVEGGSVLAGGYLRDSGNGGVRLFFNEGTKVELLPGARGRLREVDKEGTRIVIDQGTASFDVARSKDRRWFVEAGPFAVAVKGTFFSVSWEPSIERFELRLQHGSVVVSGPIAGGDIELRAGQRLVVNLPKAETLISETQAEPVASTSSRAPSPASVDPADPGSAAASANSKDASAKSSSPAAAPASSASKVERKASWPEYLAHGHWDRILAEAEVRGIDTTLETASSEELFALADAARYRRRSDLARAALLAQRRRFSGSARSLDATFLLGRVEESRDRARAIGWYEEYLERAGTGTYAAEAWGRKMVLTNELKGRAVARPLAEEYLRRFPKGSYARAARALCGEP